MAAIRTILLFSICAVFAVAIIDTLREDGQDPLGLQVARAAPTGDVVRIGFQSPPAAQFAAILERPLFTESRRPVPSTPKVPLSAVPPPEVHLTGVLLGQSQRALIRRRSGGQEDAFGVGDSIAGWDIVEIMPTGVRLERDGSETMLWIEEPEGKTARSASAGTEAGASRSSHSDRRRSAVERPRPAENNFSSN